MHIAIDGPAASGKSTIGRAIADRFGYPLLDTGQMYRAVTRTALERCVPMHEEAALVEIARAIHFDLRSDGLSIDGMPPGQDLHAPEVDEAVSEASAHPGVRRVLVDVQRTLTRMPGIVMVGRDIGTIVLPHAPVKLWLTASDPERARRRLRDQSPDVSPEAHASAVARLGSRDRFDSSRAHSPAEKAPDAIVIDTDGRSPAQVLDHALAVIASASRDGTLQDD